MTPSERRRWLGEQAEALSLRPEVAAVTSDWPGVHLALYTVPTVDGEPIPVLDLGHVQMKLSLPEYARLRASLASSEVAYEAGPLPFEVLRTYAPRRKEPGLE